MSSECEYNWYWKISACSTEYEVSDSFASLTRQQTSYSGSSGRYFRYQSIHIQITYAYTITALERDQYEVLWSRVQQYWTRRSRVQYCCTQLHKYRIKGILFSILSLSGSLSGEPDSVHFKGMRHKLPINTYTWPPTEICTFNVVSCR